LNSHLVVVVVAAVAAVVVVVVVDIDIANLFKHKTDVFHAKSKVKPDKVLEIYDAKQLKRNVLFHLTICYNCRVNS